MIQKEVNNQKRKAIQQAYDESISDRDEEDSLQNSISEGNAFWAVRKGSRTGIFTTWEEAKKATRRAQEI